MSKRKAKRFQEEYTCVDSLLHVFAISPDSNLLLKERKRIEDKWGVTYEGLTKEGQKACYVRLHKFLIGLSKVTGVDIDADEIVDELGHIAAGVE